MSSFAFLGAIETGLLFGLVALGVFLSFRVLEFPDLTVDGSFPLGAAVSASLIVSGVNPYLATLAAIGAGALAGLMTAWLNVRLKILHLLASILTMIALYSINLRIMGRPNIALLGDDTVFTVLQNLPIAMHIATPIVLAVVVLVVKIALDFFLSSQLGLAMRATGINDRMARAQGVNTKFHILLGMAISNALVALAGALFAQSQGFADVTLGVGVIVVGLAAVIGGEAIVPPRTVFLATLGCVIGSILYRLAMALALNADFIGLKTQDLNLITAVLVTLAMVLPGMRNPLRPRRAKGPPHD
ncbi:ABC transporter permease [Varunaivibrio sulfuroxidans]|uniref:Putative ABC transport system permease protein n=1 Tax=Varunaivibrio sulfuroxidans TaxID=1773489 RepID=A0A4R3J7W0_9PROT|nr:ABC transporter permease [Varunaivibrio sulfuroxidans]TCS61003.1 putative ABC transport system permease protein [Varunaivibrio sulfuroxidans]WES31591.1 ABC transporter permease [Varunaivibrio sulfuroxidans]